MNEIAKALGSALFHFLWEGVALALPLALFRMSSRARYLTATATLCAMPVVFCLTLAWVMPERHPGFSSALSLMPAYQAPMSSGPLLAIRQPLLERVQDSMRWFVPFWFAGVALFYLRGLGSWAVAQRLRRTAAVAAPEYWQRRMKNLAEAAGVRHAVALLESGLVNVPVALGFLRPAILLPAGLLTGLPVEEVEYLLLHELAHIRRFDYAVNLFQKAVEGLLFYHPAVWWVSSVMRTERENCCDDAVLRAQVDPRRYAATLATLEHNRWSAAQAGSGGNLGNRIRRILARGGNRQVHGAPVASALLIAALLITTTCAIAFASLQRAAPSIALPKIETPRVPVPMPIRTLAQLQPPRPAQPLPPAAASPWQKWLAEDVAYIATDQEKAAFAALTTDAERERFSQQFWLRRNPVPGAADNDFKMEHYRRIAFSNDHFAGTIPGWKTDRGRTYIVYGPPDEIDKHPSCAAAAEAFEDWFYRLIQGVGQDVKIRFIDSGCNGDYRRTASGRVFRGANGAEVDLNSSGDAAITMPLDPKKAFDVVARVTTPDNRPVALFGMPVEGKVLLLETIHFPAGSYVLYVSAKERGSAEPPVASGAIGFTVPE